MSWRKAVEKAEARYNEMLAYFDKLNSQSIRYLKSYVFNQLERVKLDEKAVRIAKIKSNEDIVKRLQSNFLTQLKKSGYMAMFKQFVADYDDAVKLQQHIYGEFGYNEAYGVQDIFAVDIIRRQTLEEIGGLSKVVDIEMRKLFDRSFYADGTFTELVNGIRAKLGKLEHWGYTIANTGIQTVNSAVSGEIATALGIDKFFYFGSLDKATRPFCRKILTGYNPNTGEKHPNIWTRQEISYLKNGQIADVFVHRGGYNCRHQWLPKQM